jgi:hypothetical protein
MSWEPNPTWSPEMAEYWKTLDHTMCTQYVDGLSPEEFYDTPEYQRCRSMHCPKCGKRCGSQGHMKLVGDIEGEHYKWVCPTPEAERKPFPE